MTTIDRLRALDACPEAREYIATHPTLRAAWDDCERRDWLMWLIGRAHSRGTIARQRLVQVAIRCVEPVLHLTSDCIAADLGVIAEWTVGRATRDEMSAACDRIYEERRKLRFDAYDAYAAAAAYDAAAAAAAAAAAYDAYDAAAAAAYDAYDAAICDVIRSVITVDEVCAALGIDPDAPTSAKEAA